MFTASLLVTGFTHKFIVDVNGQEIIFEPVLDEFQFLVGTIKRGNESAMPLPVTIFQFLVGTIKS